MGNCRGCPPAFFVIILAHACGYFRQSRESSDFRTNRPQFRSLTSKLNTIRITMKGWLPEAFAENATVCSDTQTSTTDSYRLLYRELGTRPLHLRGGGDGDLNDEEDDTTQVQYNMPAHKPPTYRKYFQSDRWCCDLLTGMGQRRLADSARGSCSARKGGSVLARSDRRPRPALRWSKR